MSNDATTTATPAPDARQPEMARESSLGALAGSGIPSRAKWCVHYRRLGGMPEREACKAGVVYDDLARVADLGQRGCALRLPCVRRNHDEAQRRGEPLCECPHLQWPTEEELDEDERETRAAMDRMTLGLKAVAGIRKEHRGKDWQGTIECPVCKGTLHVRHAGHNGHVWARCATDDCLQWIE